MQGALCRQLVPRVPVGLHVASWLAEIVSSAHGRASSIYVSYVMVP